MFTRLGEIPVVYSLAYLANEAIALLTSEGVLVFARSPFAEVAREICEGESLVAGHGGRVLAVALLDGGIEIMTMHGGRLARVANLAIDVDSLASIEQRLIVRDQSGQTWEIVEA